MLSKYIIQTDHNTNIQNIGKKVIHKLLKGIGKIKEHYRPLK